MTGFAPPAALLERIGPLPVAAFDDDTTPITRDRPEEYARLQHALGLNRPSCADDARYTADEGTLSATDVDGMRRACLGCKALDACHGYADAAHPSAGFWAGIQYPLTESENT